MESENLNELCSCGLADCLGRLCRLSKLPAVNRQRVEKMRLFSLILLLLAGLSPIACNAGTLVGDWLQPDPDDASFIERRAISQPITQSTEATRITLGIKSPGTTDLVDFYLIISNKTAGSSCQYTVDEVIIDS